MINVNDGQTYQTWDGVGAAMTDSVASVLGGTGASAQSTLMNNFFSQRQARHELYSAAYWRVRLRDLGLVYSYNDGSADPNLSNFSISHDTGQTISLIKAAQGINPSVKVLGTPWSPPAWDEAQRQHVCAARLTRAHLSILWRSISKSTSRATTQTTALMYPLPLQQTTLCLTSTAATVQRRKRSS